MFEFDNISFILLKYSSTWQRWHLSVRVKYTTCPCINFLVVFNQINNVSIEFFLTRFFKKLLIMDWFLIECWMKFLHLIMFLSKYLINSIVDHLNVVNRHTETIPKLESSHIIRDVYVCEVMTYWWTNELFIMKLINYLSCVIQ